MTIPGFLRHIVFCIGIAAVSAMVVRAMISARVMDRPDSRKAHANPTPKGGGVGIVAGFMLGIAILYDYADFSRIGDVYFRGVILASFLIAVVAFLDDVKSWSFVVKLAAQLIAAMAAIGSGLYVQVYNLPHFGTVDIGLFGAVATVVWLLFATNAMNFIDGLNGLASGTAFVASAFLALIAAQQGGWFVYFAALLLAAGIAGFLPFNFPRARIFMGDVGSQFCGFVLAVLGVAAARFQAIEMSFLLVPILLFGVLFDVAFTLVRRAIAGDRLTQPHRGHLYQLAHRAGMAARTVALVHWLFAAIGGVVCVIFIGAPSSAKPFVLLLVLLPQAVWLGLVIPLARRSPIGRW